MKHPHKHVDQLIHTLQSEGETEMQTETPENPQNIYTHGGVQWKH